MQPGWYWAEIDGIYIPIYHGGGGLWYYASRPLHDKFRVIQRIPYPQEQKYMITPFTLDGHDYELVSVTPQVWIVVELPSMHTLTSIFTDLTGEYYYSGDHRAHVNRTTLLDFAKSIIASEH